MVMIGGKRLSNIRYANDTTLISANIEDMKVLLEKLEKINANYGLEINKAKIKVIIVRRSCTT